MIVVGNYIMPHESTSKPARGRDDVSSRVAPQPPKMSFPILSALEADSIVGLVVLRDYLVNDLLPDAFAQWTLTRSHRDSGERALRILSDLRDAGKFPATLSHLAPPKIVYEPSLDANGEMLEAWQTSVQDLTNSFKSNLLSAMIDVRTKQIAKCNAVLNHTKFIQHCIESSWTPLLSARFGPDPTFDHRKAIKTLANAAGEDLAHNIVNYDVYASHQRQLKEAKAAKAKTDSVDAVMDIDAVHTQDSILEEVRKAISASLRPITKDIESLKAIYSVSPIPRTSIDSQTTTRRRHHRRTDQLLLILPRTRTPVPRSSQVHGPAKPIPKSKGPPRPSAPRMSTKGTQPMSNQSTSKPPIKRGIEHVKKVAKGGAKKRTKR
ncbi:BQ5605_C047g12287 [Microbotryum silenes-dioicae]|uniref:BQ5605_C047g12287 protein n=1 Tax=Microbotryum silenes-dioicae TaxID=796604 RepID=A0A2X0MPV9_9BASI|nr:BQ5605_C047g12287 [Microbotryum silenes-dioicae]